MIYEFTAIQLSGSGIWQVFLFTNLYNRIFHERHDATVLTYTVELRQAGRWWLGHQTSPGARSSSSSPITRNR